MHTSAITTRTPNSAEHEIVTELCLEAFADEAVIAWVFPDPVVRHHFMQDMFSTALSSAIMSGAVIIAVDPNDKPVAASIWLNSGTDTPQQEQASTQETPPLQRMAAVEAATQDRRPEVSHLHLSSMATLPDYRGQGAGVAMLKAGLQEARRLDLPVYLEASTSDNRRLYERVGFRNLGAPIDLPEDGPSLQPMWLDKE